MIEGSGVIVFVEVNVGGGVFVSVGERVFVGEGSIVFVDVYVADGGIGVLVSIGGISVEVTVGSTVTCLHPVATTTRIKISKVFHLIAPSNTERPYNHPIPSLIIHAVNSISN